MYSNAGHLETKSVCCIPVHSMDFCSHTLANEREGWFPTYCEEVKICSYIIFPLPEIQILYFQAAHKKHENNYKSWLFADWKAPQMPYRSDKRRWKKQNLHSQRLIKDLHSEGERSQEQEKLGLTDKTRLSSSCPDMRYATPHCHPAAQQNICQWCLLINQYYCWR